jgi:hypothetical protein
MMKKLLFTLSLLIVTSYTFAQITTLPASESFTTTFTQGVPATFLPNWTGSNVATTNKIFQDLTDYNSAPAALSIIPTSSFDGDVQVNLNLTSYQSVAVSFMAKSMLNGAGTRDVVLTMTTSIDGGTSWIGSTLIASLPNANQTAFTSYTYTLPVEAINQANVLVRFYVTRGAIGTSTAAKLVIDDVTIQQSTTPQITLSQTALTFTQVSGVPSQSQSVNVSGSNLIGNVILTPPTNFEVSLSATSGFASSLNLVPTSGNLVSTPIYVRLNSAAIGSFTGNLVVSSLQVSSQNVALTGDCVIPTVTNPIPLAITDTSFNSVLTQWDNTNPAGTYPANMALWSHATADPDLNTLFIEDWNCLYSLTARSRFTGEGVNGISMINTGNSQFTGVCDGTDPTQVTGTTVASGRAGAIVLALNTTGVVNNGSQISINWTGRTILQNFRAYGLRMQYRIGTGNGNPNIDWQEFPTTEEYISGADNTFETKTTVLPISCNNQPIVQVRWVYYFSSGTGARAQVALDDVSVDVATLGNQNFTSVNNEFKMYPNPVHGDKIHFNVASDVTVSDVSGKQVLNAKNATELNVSQLNSGIYFVRNAEGKVLKLIK